MMIKKIGIYGGAFNPPTVGHARVITELLNNKIVDTLIIVPDGNRDDKFHLIENTLRGEMCSIFCRVLKNQKYAVDICTDFLDQKKETTTYDVHLYFEKIYKKDQLIHIFGTDVVRGIPKWSNNPDAFIQTKLTKIFIKRPGYIDIEIPPSFKKYSVIEIDAVNISSSQVRTSIHEKKDVSRYVMAEVGEFIQQHSLYL